MQAQEKILGGALSPGAFGQLADPYTQIVCLLDSALMALYGQVRRNVRRILNLVLAFLPLAVLLVGSCRTAEDLSIRPAEAGSRAVQFRGALLPDASAGYVSRARDYVAGNPASLTLLTKDEVSLLYGVPQLERKDADARIWQYQASNGCVVEFYFYGADVSYVDFRAASGDPSPRQVKCLKNLSRKA